MTPPPLPPSFASLVRDGLRRFAVVLKLAALLLLVLLLQIPLLFVHDLSEERAERRGQAVADIVRGWGGSQTVVGPVLIVPLRKAAASLPAGKPAVNDRVAPAAAGSAELACFWPETLQAGGDLLPERRRRGLYDTAVYTAKLRLTGAFAVDPAALGLEPKQLDWERAWVAVSLSDLRGLEGAPTFAWNGRARSFEAGTRWPGLPDGLHAALGAEPEGPADRRATFSLGFSLRGSGEFRLAPVGRSTQLSLASNWPDPTFSGALLPTEREVTPQGFRASWTSSHLSRTFPQQWIERPNSGTDETGRQALASAFGAGLLTPLDTYATVSRSLKYGILFLVLLFTVLFLFEVTGGLRLHPVHYALVGAAVALFYLALLALSEVVPFAAAYTTAAAISSTLIVGYGAGLLRGLRRTGALLGALGGLHAFLYFVLREQDYALLAGTGGLVVALAAVMALTRRVDWSAAGEPRPASAPALSPEA